MMMKVFLSFIVLSLLSTAILADESASNSVISAITRTYYGFRPSGAGGTCGGGRFCRRRLVCEDHVCKIRAGRRCTRKPTLCQSGAVCVGSSGKKKCVIPLGISEECGSSSFRICESGLVCRNFKCVKPKVPLGGSCKPAGSVCEDGLVCAGTRRFKECVRIRGPGQKCKDNPFFICRSDLTCSGGRCKTPESGDCMEEGSVCVSGLKCVGRPGKKRCVAPRDAGSPCGTNPFRICESGLVCRGFVCSEPTISEGGSCRAAGSVCDTGLVCVGGRRRKVCRRLREVGERCKTRRLILCEDGLVCRRGRCREPVVPVGGDCSASGSICTRGSDCIRKGSKKICAVTVGRGGSCRSFSTVCDDGLTCFRSKCVKIRRGLGDRCGGQVRCGGGLSCKFLQYLGKAACVRISSSGKRCGRFVICPLGQKCFKGKCYSPHYIHH